MTIEINEIEVGECYVTSSGQVRRVLGHESGKVEYESRGKRVGPFSNSVVVDEGKFVDDVDRQVPLHFDPDFGE